MQQGQRSGQSDRQVRCYEEHIKDVFENDVSKDKNFLIVTQIVSNKTLIMAKNEVASNVTISIRPA